MRAVLLTSTALLIGTAAMAQTVVNVPLGASIQAAINSAPGGSTIQLAAGTYTSQQFQLPSGDTITGAPGGGTILNGNGMTSPMLSANGATNVTVSDLTVTGYQTPSQQGAIHTGANWSLLNVTATGNGAAGAYIGGVNNLVQGGSYSNNGQEGLAGSQADGSKIIGITANNNNAAGAHDTAFEAGGVKITATDGLTISGSTFQGNNGPGIWADIDSSNWTITGNGIANNTGAGIQYEISHTATITGNLVVNNQGSQIYISNSDGSVISGNGVVAPGTLTGPAVGGGIVLWSNQRSDSSDLSENDSVTNNTIVGPASTTGAFSVVGTQPGNTVANNTFEAAGAAGNAAAAAAAKTAAPAPAPAPAAQIAAVPQQSNAPQTSNAPPAIPQSLAPAASALDQSAVPASTPAAAPAIPASAPARLASAPSALPAACTFGN